MPRSKSLRSSTGHALLPKIYCNTHATSGRLERFPVGTRKGEADLAWLAACAEHFQKRGNHIRIELGAGVFLQFIKRRFPGHGPLIGTVACHGVESVRDSQNPAAKGDVLSLQAQGIALSVPSFVVLQDPFGYGRQIWESGRACE